MNELNVAINLRNYGDQETRNQIDSPLIFSGGSLAEIASDGHHHELIEGTDFFFTTAADSYVDSPEFLRDTILFEMLECEEN